MDETLERLVQIGTVEALDETNKKARVKHQNTGIISDWLYVVQHPAMGVAVKEDGKHTHTITDTYSGGGSASEVPNHKHTGTVTTSWMPKINDTVLVIYLPVFNSDGFIIGKIGGG
jgi:phage baseplate assembly protein gpV